MREGSAGFGRRALQSFREAIVSMMTASPVTAGTYPPDYEAVPTVTELALRGLAVERPRTVPDYRTGKTRTELRYEVTPEGQKILNEAMARNAERCRAWAAR